MTLDKALAGQGFSPAAPATADPEHACLSLKAGIGTNGLVLQDGETIEENIDDPNRTATGHVHNRRAILERNLVGAKSACAVRMEVPPRSRAIATSWLSTGSTDQACESAKDLAGRIERLLPEGG
ncbi:hypothetical protein [Amycolatopsis jejuensis]|uniref:hypothetical protein n=1 Tax=Amycolatopsis jejuensis TaxID=330084 RepID=UPI0005248AE9|nr:hypothetical protein [Amycolatopsis jejuensis]